jgi:hypothetical protein
MMLVRDVTTGPVVSEQPTTEVLGAYPIADGADLAEQMLRLGIRSAPVVGPVTVMAAAVRGVADVRVQGEETR